MVLVSKAGHLVGSPARGRLREDIRITREVESRVEETEAGELRV